MSGDAPAALTRYTAEGLDVGIGDSVQTLEVHWNNASAQQGWSPTIAADFNGDSNVDLYGEYDSAAWVLVNDGQELFLLPWGDGLSGARLLGTGDVNNDGLTDIIGVAEPFSSSSPARLVVAVNDPEAGFVTSVWSDAPGQNSDRLFLADFDGDGQTDVLGSHDGRWKLARSTSQADRGEFALQDWGPAPDFNWQNVVTGDFDGDQFQDIAARGTDHTWWVWRGTATGMLPAKYWGHWKNAGQDEWFDVRTEDLNADGLDDIIGRAGDGTLWVGTSVQKEFHSWRWATGWGKGGNWQNITTADFTGDGRLDQVGQAGDGTWWIAENMGRRFKNSFLDRNPGVPLATATNGLQSEPVAVFDSVPNTAQSREPDPESQPLRVGFNDAAELTVSGGGQQLRAIELRSVSGSLVSPAELNGQLGEPVISESTRIRFEFAEPITVDHEVSLGVKWLETSTATDLEVVYDAVEVKAEVDQSIFASLAANQITPDRNVRHYYETFADPDHSATKLAEIPPGPDVDSAVQGGEELSQLGEPVVDEPVVEEPVIEEPVIEEPVIEEPVVEEPVVEEPVAEEPVVEEPVAEEPVVEEPVVEEPVVEEPVVEEPVVDEPIVEEPIVEEPIVEEPVVEEPVAEEPVVEEPVVEEPVVDEPIVEEPVVEEPVAEEPVVEEPVVEEPVVDEPIVEEPVVEEPVAEEPVVEEPVTEEPITEEPITEEPIAERTLSVSLDQDSLAIDGTGTSAHVVRIESPTESLVPGNSPAPFDEFLVKHAGLVVLASLDPVVFDEQLILDVSWSSGSATDQLIVEYASAGEDWKPARLFGQRSSQTSSTDPPSISDPAEESDPVTVSLNDEFRFVLSGSGQSLLGLNFLSEEGGLLAGTNPRPFELFVANKPEQVTLGTFGTLITIDGDLTLDVGWNPDNDLASLVVEYGNAEAEAVAVELKPQPEADTLSS